MLVGLQLTKVASLDSLTKGALARLRISLSGSSTHVYHPNHLLKLEAMSRLINITELELVLRSSSCFLCHEC